MIQTLFLVFDQDKRVSYMGELVGVLIVLLNNMHIMEFPKQIHTDTHTQTHTHTHTRSSADHSTAIDLSKSPAPGNIPHTHDASAAAAATECKYDNWWCFPNLLDHQHA